MARIIDGKFLAAKLRARVADEVTRVQRWERLTPGLAVILVGNNPASEVYVRSKHNQTQAAGMASFEHVLPADVAQNELLMLIARLNCDPLVHGILRNFRRQNRSIPRKSLLPLIPRRMSMDCIRITPDALRVGYRRCHRVRRLAASSLRRAYMRRFKAWTPS